MTPVLVVVVTNILKSDCFLKIPEKKNDFFHDSRYYRAKRLAPYDTIVQLSRPNGFSTDDDRPAK